MAGTRGGKAVQREQGPGAAAEPSRHSADERARFFARIEPHLRQLYNFIRRELADHEALGYLPRGQVSVADVAADVVLRAYEARDQGLTDRDWRNRLLQLAIEQLAREVREARQRRRAVATEARIPETPPEQWVSTLGDEVLDFHQPEQDERVEDVIPAADVPMPEEILEQRELQQLLRRALASMPRAWRRAFVLREVEQLEPEEIAQITGHAVSEVERDLGHARQYLRERLVEAGLASAAPAHADAADLYRRPVDVAVPAAFRLDLEGRVASGTARPRARPGAAQAETVARDEDGSRDAVNPGRSER
jgi:RNA polymerase sigma factor (sigma-70 family)